jgi:hypothetical protein
MELNDCPDLQTHHDGPLPGRKLGVARCNSVWRNKTTAATDLELMARNERVS